MTPEERLELTADIITALRNGDHFLTEDEYQRIKLALKKEAQSFRLREAIIEKTLTSLVWLFIVETGLVIVEYLRSKPDDAPTT